MQTLVFDSPEALQLALAAGWVPPEVQRGPVSFSRAGPSVRVQPGSQLPPAVLARLSQGGVAVTDEAPAAANASCWAELLATHRVPGPVSSLSQVLFCARTDGWSMLSLCGEMLRLGCDRQEVRQLERAGERWTLVRVSEPPYYTVTQAQDHVAGLTAFVPASPGQEHVWVELGYAHPLAGQLSAPDGAMVLVPARGPWLLFPAGAWQDLYQLADIALPPAEAARPAGDVPRLAVTLRLSRSTRADSPSLWVLDGPEAVDRVEALLESTPEETAARLLFAVVERASGPAVLLKSRPGRESGPALVLEGGAYAPLFQISNLFAPVHRSLEPPLRRDRLRELLAPDPERVVWLEPSGAEGFRLHGVPEAAFAPVGEWVDYVLDRAAEPLAHWVRGATFSFERFESTGAEWAAGPPRAESPTPPELEVFEPEPKPAPRREEARPAPAAATIEAGAAGAEPTAAPAPTGLEVELASLEARFRELEGPADSPDRVELWARLGAVQGRLGRAREAALCFTRALWNAPVSRTRELAQAWAAAEAQAPLDELLSLAAPTADQTRSVAVQVVVAAATPGQAGPLASSLHGVQVWLDRHDDDLDARSFWLARVALAELAGKDPLGLARARDRLLARLYRGLSLERDVPRFLRQSQSDASGRAQAGRVAEQLEALLARVEKTPRKRSAVEAPVELSLAYVRLVFAWGLARLSHSDRARALREVALARLSGDDQGQRWLAAAFSTRVEQALEGNDPQEPLPAGLLAALNQLSDEGDERRSDLIRYQLDRIRQGSVILEPQERIDPFAGFLQGRRDSRGEEFAGLRAAQGTAELFELAQPLMQRIADGGTQPAERGRLADGLMDFLPALPESQAVPMLEAMLRSLDGLAVPERAAVLEDALRVAGHFDQGSLVRQLSGSLEQLFAQMGAEHAAEAGRVLAAGVRSLRRVGLRAEAAALLRAARGAAVGPSARALAARLSLAAGFFYLGQQEAARPIVEEALARLADERLIISERLLVHRATALALAHAPADEALPLLSRLADQLPWITDSYNTNRYLCVSLLDFCDALVLGYVAEDLFLSDAVRRFLEEDEYLVRRRVHRDAQPTA